MSTLRQGWESIASGPDWASNSRSPQGTLQASKTLSPAPKSRATWCSLIAMLQSKNLVGSHLFLSGLGKPIGSGTYFAVFKHKITLLGETLSLRDQDRKRLELGTVIALKRVIPRINAQSGDVDLADERQLAAVALEVRVLTTPELRAHPNIVSLISVAWESRGSYSTAWPTLVLECCDCSLSDLQRHSLRALSIDEKLAVGLGVGHGIQALHSQFFVHGDVKSENVLIKIEGFGKLVPKLADFGCALVDGAESSGGDSIWVGGTNPWRAPEVVEAGGWIPRREARATDLYSYGLLWWRLLRDGKDPFAAIFGAEVDGAAKEEKKAQKAAGGLAAAVAEDIRRMAPDVAAVRDVAELAHCLLQLTASDRLEAISTSQVRDLVPGLGNSAPIILGATTGSSYQSSAWEAAIKATQSTILAVNIKELRAAEVLFEEDGLGEETGRRVFQELLDMHKEVAFESERSSLCEGCCNFTAFDRDPKSRPPGLGVEDYAQAETENLAKHTCTDVSRDSAPGMPAGMKFTGDATIIQLAACYLDGYGTERDIDRALAVLTRSAQRGLSQIQHDLASVYRTLRRPLPEHVPIRRWMMAGVILRNSGGSSEVLRETDPELFSIAIAFRSRVYDGISLASPRADDSLSAAEEGGYTDLHKACGSYEEPLQFIRNSFKPTSRWRRALGVRRAPTDIESRDGETPLLVACRAGRVSVAMLLLELGADATKATHARRETPLHWAAVMEDGADLVSALVASGASVHAQSARGLLYPPWAWSGLVSSHRLSCLYGTPLQWAVAAGNVGTARALLDRGADIDLTPLGTHSPIANAARLGMADVVETLLIRKSAEYRIGKSVMLQLVADPTLTNRCLHGIDENGLIKTAQLLSPHCPRSDLDEVQDFFSTTVTFAVSGAPLELLDAILSCLDESSASCGGTRGRPLEGRFWAEKKLSQEAARRADPEILELLLRSGAQIVPETLHIPAMRGIGWDCMKVLLEHGAQIDLPNHSGTWTPYRLAVLNGNLEIANTLAKLMTPAQLSTALSPDASISGRKGQRCTLLGAVIHMISQTHAKTAGVEYLLDLPQELGAANFVVSAEGSSTALHFALDKFDLNEGFFKDSDSLRLVRLLLSRFPESDHVNARDSFGTAPLHVAAWLAKLEECQLLVEAGADLDIADNEGRTPLDACFLHAPGGMVPKPGEVEPTLEMYRRFEEGRNACALYLHERGARRGKAQPVTDGVAVEVQVPFPERHKVTLGRRNRELTTLA